MTKLTTREMAERISDLLFAHAGSDGDMCAQDVAIEDIEAVLAGTESPHLATDINRERDQRLASAATD